jgi:hypothetical protein
MTCKRMMHGELCMAGGSTHRLDLCMIRHRMDAIQPSFICNRTIPARELGGGAVIAVLAVGW